MKRRVAAAAFTIALAPSYAHAHQSDVSGLAVYVMGVFVGVPAALALIVCLVVLRRAKPGRFARAMRFVAPALGLAYPGTMIAFGMRADLIVASLVVNVPVLVLAIAVTIVAVRRSVHSAGVLRE